MYRQIASLTNHCRTVGALWQPTNHSLSCYCSTVVHPATAKVGPEAACSTPCPASLPGMACGGEHLGTALSIYSLGIYTPSMDTEVRMVKNTKVGMEVIMVLAFLNLALIVIIFFVNRQLQK